MALEILTNGVTTTLNGSITSSQTTIVVASAANMPSSGQFRVVVESTLGNGTGEIMLCTGRSGTTLTVVRNYETVPGAGSNPQAFSSGASVSLQLTAGAVETYVTQNESPIPAAESSNFNATAGNLYVVTTGSSTITATLPAPSLGTTIEFKKTDSGAGSLSISSATNGGQILGPGCGSGLTAVPLGAQGAYVTLSADGTNWHVVDGQLDSGWLAPTMQNSWIPYGGATLGYRRTGNEVRLRGGLWGGTTATVAFTLPAGFLPSGFVDQNVTAGSVTAAATIIISNSTGQVTVFWPTSANDVFLDGVTFTVD